ncbi:MAG: 3-oxo-tetronate kinase, partial [Pseudomonadota bacterium]
MAILLGCIADDNTGATDLANTLVANGMRTIQIIGVPEAGQPAPDAEAVVVALKSRTIPAQDAIDQSLETLKWLQRNGARQIFFKYCSTFDSTDEGNIGPVAEALLDALGEDFSIACPAFPVNGRTIFKGYLFVGDVLLSESGMQNHPLTPMTDPSLVHVLDRQSKADVGLVEYGDVDRGPDSIRARFDELRAEGRRLAIVDAVSDRHLRDIGAACDGLGLVTGGSGVAMGLPENFRSRGILPANIDAAALPPASGKAAILAGSCSQATLGQIAQFT